MRLTSKLLCLACLLIALFVPAASADAAPRGLPKDVRQAYKQMGCKFGNVITSHGDGEPRFKGATCWVRNRGDFEIDHYYNAEAGRQYWLEYFLGGDPYAWVTIKGHLIITNSKPNGHAYDEGLARWAASRIGGRAAHGTAERPLAIRMGVG